MAGGTTYQLSLILTLVDKLSSGLRGSTSNLKTFERESKQAVVQRNLLQRAFDKILPSRSTNQLAGTLRKVTTESNSAENAHKKLRREAEKSITPKINTSGIQKAKKDVQGLRKALLEPLDPLKAVGGAAAAYGGVSYLRSGYRASTSQEDARATLSATIAKVENGKVNQPLLESQRKQIVEIAMQLGDKLPGNTTQFLDMATTLSQRSVKVEDLTGGAFKASAYLATANRADPQQTAEEVARFGGIFALTGQEFTRATDILSRIYTSKGIAPGELVEASKYFSGRAGNPLGQTGLQGAENTTRFLGFMRQKTGEEGSSLGTMSASLMTRLIRQPKEARDGLKELKQKTGVDLSPVDKQGKFKGFEYMAEQFAKLEGKLSHKDTVTYASKIGGEEGAAAFTALIREGKTYQAFQQSLNETVGMLERVDLMTSTSSAKLESLQGTYENLNAQAFEQVTKSLDPAIDKTNTLVSNLRGIAEQHPYIASVAVGIGGIGTAAGGSILSVDGLLGKLRQIREVSGGVGGGGGGGIAGTDYDLSDVGVGVLAGKSILGKVLRGAGKLIGISAPVGAGAVGGAAVGTGAAVVGGAVSVEVGRRQVVEIQSALTDVVKSRENEFSEYSTLERQAREKALAYTDTRRQRPANSDEVTQAAKVAFQFSSLTGFSDFSTGVKRHSESQPWLERASKIADKNSDPSTKSGEYLRQTAQLLNERTSGLLRFPEMVNQFRAEIKNLNLSPETQNAAFQVLDVAALHARQSSDDLTRAMLALVQPSQELGTNFGQIIQPSGQLPNAFNRASTSASSFAARLNGIQITPPTFNFSVPTPNFPSFPQPKTQPGQPQTKPLLPPVRQGNSGFYFNSSLNKPDQQRPVPRALRASLPEPTPSILRIPAAFASPEQASAPRTLRASLPDSTPQRPPSELARRLEANRQAERQVAAQTASTSRANTYSFGDIHIHGAPTDAPEDFARRFKREAQIRMERI
ncbi:MAG: phage tail tape measure protein [Pyrinomonadaceae bacterium MAG19_C2-C3]|nr:phage tail tape measure protein [Pyrinomonadaceae bacterium MAG19_C2-C3]